MKLLRGLTAAILGLALFIGAVTLIMQFLAPKPYAAMVVDPAALKAAGGHAVQADVALKPSWPWFYETRADSVDTPYESSLVILEDGHPIGPPHSYHIDIAKEGTGRYSHWGTSASSVIIFSASDNSDPGVNGRRYEISAQPRPYLFFTTCMLLLPLTLILLQQLLLPQFDLTAGLIAIISLGAAAAWGSLLFNQTTVAPDSITYVRWSSLVPLGYPLFVSVVKSVFGTLRYVSATQVGLLVGACVCVAYATKNVGRRGVIQLGILLLLLCYIPMFWHASWLLSEGLFIPLILLNLAAAFWLVGQQRSWYAMVLAVSASLILFVRPAGYYVPAGMVFLVIALRGRAGWMVKYACVPFAVCVAATFAINYGVRGSGAQSQVGRVLFPTVAFIFQPEFVTGPHSEFASAVEEVLTQRREKYQKAPDREARVVFSLGDYNSRLAAMDQALDRKCGTGCSFGFKEEMYVTFFLATILNRPRAYLDLVAEQVLTAWTSYVMANYGYFRIAYLQEADAGPAFHLDGGGGRLHPDLLDALPGRFVEPFDDEYVFLRKQRWFIYLVGIVTLIALPISVFFRRDSFYWISLGYCGVMIHGSLLLTSAVTVFLHRYALSVDPVILVAGAIMVSGFIAWCIRRGFEATDWLRAMTVVWRRLRGGKLTHAPAWGDAVGDRQTMIARS